jgi:hypothetical protein
MTNSNGQSPRRRNRVVIYISVVLVAVLATTLAYVFDWAKPATSTPVSGPPGRVFKPRKPMDVSGFSMLSGSVGPWDPKASPKEIGRYWERVGYREIQSIDRALAEPGKSVEAVVKMAVIKAAFLNYEGEANKAYAFLKEVRDLVEQDDSVAEEWLYLIVYCQGVTAMRRGGVCDQVSDSLECCG